MSHAMQRACGDDLDHAAGAPGARVRRATRDAVEPGGFDRAQKTRIGSRAVEAALHAAALFPRQRAVIGPAAGCGQRRRLARPQRRAPSRAQMVARTCPVPVEPRQRAREPGAVRKKLRSSGSISSRTAAIRSSIPPARDSPIGCAARGPAAGRHARAGGGAALGARLPRRARRSRRPGRPNCPRRSPRTNWARRRR